MIRIFLTLFLALGLCAGMAYAQPNPAKRTKIMTSAKRLGFTNLSYFEDGVYGKLGTAVVFITSTDIIADEDRLYWAMVKVLSKKYGCFIKRKIKDGNTQTFYCRDGRHIVMRNNIGDKLVYFYSKQYYSSGREVIVDRNKTRKGYTH